MIWAAFGVSWFAFGGAHWPLATAHATLCGSERVVVVSTEPPDDLSCLTTLGSGSGVGGGSETQKSKSCLAPPPPPAPLSNPHPSPPSEGADTISCPKRPRSFDKNGPPFAVQLVCKGQGVGPGALLLRRGGGTPRWGHTRVQSGGLCTPGGAGGVAQPAPHKPQQRRQQQSAVVGVGGGTGRGASEGKGPQRRPQRRLGRRLEEVAKAVGGGYCRLQLPLRLALGVRGTVAGHRQGALEGGWSPPPFQCLPLGGGVWPIQRSAGLRCFFFGGSSGGRSRFLGGTSSFCAALGRPVDRASAIPRKCGGAGEARR